MQTASNVSPIAQGPANASIQSDLGPVPLTAHCVTGTVRLSMNMSDAFVTGAMMMGGGLLVSWVARQIGKAFGADAK